MHDVRLLFDAMDHSWPIAIYVTSLFLFTVWIGCRVIQLAWSYLEPHVYLWLNFRKESSREVSSEMSPASSRMAATALRTQVRRDVHERFKSRVAERSDTAIWSDPPRGRQASNPAGAQNAANYHREGFMTPKGAA